MLFRCDLRHQSTRFQRVPKQSFSKKHRKVNFRHLKKSKAKLEELRRFTGRRLKHRNQRQNLVLIHRISNFEHITTVKREESIQIVANCLLEDTSYLFTRDY